LKGKLKLIKAAVQNAKVSSAWIAEQKPRCLWLKPGHMWHEPEKVAEWVQAIMAGVGEGWIRPHVDKAFAFEQSGDAHSYMESRKNIGKVLCWSPEVLRV